MDPSPNTAIQRLPVMESFYTIQGEGFHQGRAAYFIRLGGCDVGCPWCDVKESWDAALHPLYPVEEIVKGAVESHPPVSPGHKKKDKIAVITGGEPLMHDCTELTGQLQESGFYTHIETSGAYPLSGSWDWICLSPKKFKAPVKEIIGLADELKVVIFHPSDFQWAEKYASLVSAGCKLFLQPEWERSAEVTPLIINYIKGHPLWSFSLQLHKYIHVP
jgi:7-carboxy-7-deazaguanine synthase